MSWEPGFVSLALPEYVGVRRQLGRRGAVLKIAYEDIRLAPSSSLLQELDALEHDCDASKASDLDEPSPKQTFSSLLTSTVSAPIDAPDESTKDVGPVTSSVAQTLEPTTLDREITEQMLLKQIQAAIGDYEVSITQLKCAPTWLLDKAVTTEKENYLKACRPIKLLDLPPRSNVISSHHFFSIKKTSDGNLKLKCRMVPHGNRDREKAGLRTDSATAQFAAIRLLLSLAVLLNFRLFSIDISGAYLQADPITRDIFVRPPTGWTSPNVVWKILRPAYGLVESGRLWKLAIERWLFDYGFETLPGLSQFFILRDNSGRITILLAKVVDDLLLAGSVTTMNDFYKALCARFKVGRFTCDRPFIFNALNITQDHSSSSITMDMLDYPAKCIPLSFSPTRLKESDIPATPEERTDYQSLAGTLNFFGHGGLPPACFVDSYLQQQLGDLRVHHLAHANSLLKEILQLQPKLYFPSAPAQSHDPHLVAWSDAAHGTTYGQSGYLAGLQLTGSTPDSSILHTLDWSSSKQRRVSFSSIGSEILAAASAADRGKAFALSFRILLLPSTLNSVSTLKVFTIQLRLCMNPKTIVCVLPSPVFEIHLVPKKFAFYAGFPGPKIWPIVLPKATMSCSAC
jgi:Reverse transcriptase (RNA-dependent DNA polymerase)